MPVVKVFAFLARAEGICSVTPAKAGVHMDSREKAGIISGFLLAQE